MTKQNDKCIEAARRSFNDELLSPDYPGIHHHDSQIGRMVAFLEPRPGGTYLDLATGVGAMAFAVAGHQPEAQVFGIDIADQALSCGTRRLPGRRAAPISSSGSPMGEPSTFPMIASTAYPAAMRCITFPEVDVTLANVRRALKPGGAFAVADVVRHPSDEGDFVNAFQALKPDGHVRIYSAADLVDLFRGHGFAAQAQFGSTITFSRGLNDEYRALIAATPPGVLAGYGVEGDGDQATVTFDILTLKFVPVAE